MEESSEEFQKMISENELKDCAILVFANKQDLPDALDSSQLSQKFGITNITTHRHHVQPCSSVSGEGIREGLDWLVSAMMDVASEKKEKL